MNRPYETSQKNVKLTENAKAKGRMLMARRGNTSKIVLSFLFCVLAAMLSLMSLDAVATFLVPDRWEDAAVMLSVVFAIVVYFMADTQLLRLGVRMERDRAELFDFGKKGNGSGFVASLAMGVGVMALIAVISAFYAYVETFSAYVQVALGAGVNGLCLILVTFLCITLFTYVATSLFFLPAVAERRNLGFWGILCASARAARGKRWEIIKFFLSFALLTLLSLLSLGILFFVYVVPFYIMSYGAFTSEVLDYKETLL